MGKNLFRKALAALCAAGLLLAAAGCADEDNSKEPSGATMYTVTFDSKGGSEVAQQSVESGKTVSKPANDPTKSGVTFGGWYKGEEPFSFSAAITGSITLTAKWISEQYTKGSTVLTFYDDKTFEYKDANGTSRGTYTKSDDGKIEATFTGGSKQGSTLEVDTSDGAPSVKEDGTDVGGFEQVEEPTNQNTQDGGSLSVKYDVGTVVEFDGVQYLVIKNTETPLLTVTKSPAHHYYPNAKADAYREHLIEKYEIDEPYVILFNTESVKTTPTTETVWPDEYLIMRSGEKHFRIRHRWSSGNGKIDAEIFKSITADELRKDYDPTSIYVENYSPVFGNDSSKKISDEYLFNYENDKKTVMYGDEHLARVNKYLSYVYIHANDYTDGKTSSQYADYDKISDKQRSYTLRNPYNPNTGIMFEFRIDYNDAERTEIRRYRLFANTKGTIVDDTTDKDYQTTLAINYPLFYNSDGVHIRFDVSSTNNKLNASFSGLEESADTETDDENSNKGVGKYVAVSESKTKINDIEVPEEITFSVPFAYEGDDVVLDKFTKVTFVPMPYDNAAVIYVPKEGKNSPYDFIDKFKDGYDIFGEYSETIPEE